MLPHWDEGTHKLELPVSRTTLKVCGGVPMVISEKSTVVSKRLRALMRLSYIERSGSC